MRVLAPILILVALALAVLAMYLVVAWVLDRTRGRRCPRCGLRGALVDDPLLGAVCGHCERLRILAETPPRDDIERDLAERASRRLATLPAPHHTRRDGPDTGEPRGGGRP